MNIPEDFLHYLWKFRLFPQHGLTTSSGEPLDIIAVGLHNKHSGPDFENAKLRIAGTIWAGNVEIHLKSSDWEQHQHQFDRSYDNVILHVVGEHDREIYRTDGTMIPVLALKDLMPQRITDNYLSLIECMDWIPCGKQVSKIDPFVIKSWLQRVEIERLEEKAALIDDVLNEFRGSWDDAFYIFLAKNFGFKINAIPFEMLARSLPQQLFAKYKNRPLQIEALIFGQAGFLDHAYADDYPQTLRKEYAFLRQKHSLVPLDNYLWKYMRLRPRNFPTIRLAQFSALVIKSNHLFSNIIREKDPKLILQMFEKSPVNNYWRSHYRFEFKCSPLSATMGDQSVRNILINTVAVFLMAYGRKTGSSEHVDRSLNLLENLPAETNAIMNRFKEVGLDPANAYYSQSLLQLKKAYCDQKKCLSCGIGIKLLNI